MKDGSAFSLTVRIVTPQRAEGGGWRSNGGVPFNLTYSDVMKRVAAALEADGLDATVTPTDVQYSVVPGVITEPGGVTVCPDCHGSGDVAHAIDLTDAVGCPRCDSTGMIG